TSVDLVRQRGADRAAAEGRVAPAVEDEPPAIGLRDVRQPVWVQVRVVGVVLPGDGDVQGVVQLVGPLGVHAEAAELARPQGGGVVAVRLGDEQQRAAQPAGQLGGRVRDGGQDVGR